MRDENWRIELLGGLRAVRDERVVDRFPTQKTAVLFAFLACHPRRAHPREVLIELLWPEASLDTGRHRLSVALSSLRQQFAPPGASTTPLLVTDRSTVRLDPDRATTDVAAFEALLEAAGKLPASALAGETVAERIRLLAEALDLWRGELLPGYYEDWILAERQRLDLLCFQALRQVTADLIETRDPQRALQYALRAVRADPLCEEAHQDVMRLYAGLGQPAAALRQYGDLERLLRAELDQAPSDAVRALAELIRSSGVQVFGRSGTEGEKGRRGEGESRQRRDDLLSGSSSPLLPFSPSVPLEPAGGAVPLNSPFYVERAADREFRTAMERGDSIVLVKGARQVGKTSLLARGVQQARQGGARVILTDLEKLNADELVSADTLLRALALRIADALDLEVSPLERWTPHRGANANFERFMERDVLGAVSAPIVWVLDEVDRLFTCDYGSEIFGLFRSWHNQRALDPESPWFRFTLAIAYATEAHLFITDLNKSPFNVGTRLTLEDFSLEQVADLNRRSGSPLRDAAEVERYFLLIGGHPYLTRRGLYEMGTHGVSMASLETRAESDEGPFGDHLRRMLSALTRDAELCEAMRAVLQGRPCPSAESFYRLRSAGLITGDSARDVRPRCQLYARYLAERLD
jgi:DNA-binding SARP family transcriptional activator